MYAVITTVTIIRSAKIMSAGCSHVIHFTYFPATTCDLFFSHFINQQFRCHLSHIRFLSTHDDHLLYKFFNLLRFFIAIENSTLWRRDSLVFFGGEITYISISLFLFLTSMGKRSNFFILT